MKRVPVMVAVRCLLRSFFLQAAWNVRGMQNLGFASAIWPALRHLYPDERERQQALERHLETFNSHPYLTAAILGGAIHHEARVADGDDPPERVRSFKTALAGPLAASGDAFFWAGLRPALAAAAACLVPLLGATAIVYFLVAYNLVHLTTRLYLFQRGLALGDGLLAPLARMRLPHRTLLAKGLAALTAPMAVMLHVGSQPGVPGYSGFWIPMAAGVGAVALLLVARARVGPYPVLALGAAFGAILGAMGGF